MRDRAIFVTGCGRSGTMYMADYLQSLGLDVRHEKYGDDGISSFYIAMPGRADDARRQYQGRKIKVIHIVRSPLLVVSSMYRCEHIRSRGALDVYRRNYSDDVWKGIGQKALCAKWYVDWNRAVEKYHHVDLRIHIESVARLSNIKSICDLVGVEYKHDFFFSIGNIPTNTHKLNRDEVHCLRRNSPDVLNTDLTIEDIRREDQSIADRFERISQEYGYRQNKYSY